MHRAPGLKSTASIQEGHSKACARYLHSLACTVKLNSIAPAPLLLSVSVSSSAAWQAAAPAARTPSFTAEEQLEGGAAIPRSLKHFLLPERALPRRSAHGKSKSEWVQVRAAARCGGTVRVHSIRREVNTSQSVCLGPRIWGGSPLKFVFCVTSVPSRIMGPRIRGGNSLSLTR